MEHWISQIGMETFSNGDMKADYREDNRPESHKSHPIVQMAYNEPLMKSEQQLETIVESSQLFQLQDTLKETRQQVEATETAGSFTLTQLEPSLPVDQQLNHHVVDLPLKPSSVRCLPVVTNERCQTKGEKKSHDQRSRISNKAISKYSFQVHSRRPMDVTFFQCKFCPTRFKRVKSANSETFPGPYDYERFRASCLFQAYLSTGTSNEPYICVQCCQNILSG